ncbi:MAG: nucleotidyltransferase domain-containing protein [Elusimicrobiaceae bacterium]|nr:nucleotidyltransferase domain-containing protein [Elusimicrobiaceae bacterium]
MINIEEYISDLIVLLKQHFGQRLLYVGLQGSYLRGEATADSDMDIMVLLDGLTVADLTQYRVIINSLPLADKSCGFICAKADLDNWNPLEICHVLHSTKDYYGVLKDLVPSYGQEDVRNFVKFGLNNLYHELCHRYIHADRKINMEALPFTYKSVFFILQNLYYLKHKIFISTKTHLLEVLDGQDRAVLEEALKLQQGNLYNFDESFELLFKWCQSTLQTV